MEWDWISIRSILWYFSFIVLFLSLFITSRASTKNTQKHQLCLSIRTGIDAALDVNRMVYLQTITDTEELIQQYQQQCIDYWLIHVY